MIMQVHDELVFDLLNSEEKKVNELVRTEMESVAKLRVPLKVKISAGDSWFRE